TKAEEVMEWLHEISSTSSFGIKTTEAPHYRRVAIQQAEDSHKSQGRPRITAGDGFAFISHTGEVFPSGFLPQSAGNVRNQSIVDIYRNSELFLDLRDPDNLKGKCGVCKYRQVCGGSRSRAFATTGDPLASDPLCAYIPPAFDDGVQIQEM
ncbi:MAG: radical SAM/SPASM domain-containing protein, partial [Halobacteriaceae archaeon]